MSAMPTPTPPSASAIQWHQGSQLMALPADAVIAQADVVAVVPYLDRQRAEQTCRLLVTRAGAPLTVLAIHDDTRCGPAALWNLGLQHTRGTWFAYLADDAFAGRGWLLVALRALQRHPRPLLLAFNDGKWYGQLAAFGLAHRPWVSGLYEGTLFHPSYRQHYGDTELTLIARQQGGLVYEPNAVMVEVDAEKDGKGVLPEDRLAFQQRQFAGFDGRVTDAALLSLFR